MDIIGLYYCNITHAKIILTNQKRVVDYISKQNKNIVKYLKYQYNRLDATPLIGVRNSQVNLHFVRKR